MNYQYKEDEVYKCVDCNSKIDAKTNVGTKCKTKELCYDEQGRDAIRVKECLWGEV